MVDFARRTLPRAKTVSTATCQSCVFSIGDGELLAGSIPPSKARLVQAWIEIHREELMADWQLAVAGQQPHKIEPLR